ncbi:unnamed protein product [Microthlaspi erraticum]|uniref:NB-ARC domain-containing protein n=1 Tax=Microthlaspi erraticum TaxID=1685480 RepID=A0A6D2J010_9BRAS|nr:unnamed protein product [Microthlaspi erraticum]
MNLEALAKAMEDLRAKREDLNQGSHRGERGRQKLATTEVWLKRVATIEKNVSDLIGRREDELARLCLFGFCSNSLISSYRYGEKVSLTLQEVEELKNNCWSRTMLDDAWKHLMKDGVGTMGMYGMGGVGKTTLLKQIYNKFSEERCGFDFVIWVVVSKELHVEKIQNEIAQEIDDIWEKVDLIEIGVPIPAPENRCKVVSPLVAKTYEAIQRSQLAKDIARKCGGLPLALNVIGETMSCKRTVEEWRHAINVLTSYATEFSGMEDKILPLLKYSYDNLKGEDVKSCLLYCALFPEDYQISKENL